MEQFVNKYGQVFELPSYYIMDSTIYPTKPDDADEGITYAMILVAFGIPGVTTNKEQKEQIIVRTFMQDSEGMAAHGKTKDPIDENLD